MKHLFTFVVVISTNLLLSCDTLNGEHDTLTMEQMQSDKTTLIVTSSPNPNEMEALKNYVEGVMPLLLNLGGRVVKRSKLTDVYYGEKSFVFLLVMDFPSKKALIDMFDSEAYQSLIPARNKGFTDIHILMADDLE